MKNFALIGASGYIAPRHMKAIKDTGNVLTAAYDPYDGVGILDAYFPNADFFTEFERFDRHVDKLKRKGSPIEYVSICSPNYLHDAHIRFGLRNDADVICEKPLVLNPWTNERLLDVEKETGKRIYSILQLRLHPEIEALRQKIASGPKDKVYDIDLVYITARGNWYYSSWKGDESKSGGISTNIGIHFFDMLAYVFGPSIANTVHIHTHDRASGMLELKQARIRWFLSINYETIPIEIRAKGMRTFRSLTIGGEEIEFSEGFTDLHTRSYEEIFAGRGFGLKESITAIQIAYDIRKADPIGLKGDYHPLAKLPQVSHPFGH